MATSTQTPRVSIIIPAYNGERYIQQAIESVLQQSYCNYEIIVVDDGSTDQTCEILQPYTRQIRLFSQNNQGVAAARNRGIQEARGELIALLDQDDIFLPEKLAHQVACFDAEPDVGMVNSGWQLMDAEGNPISKIEPWQFLPTLDLETWVVRTPVLPSALMFRRRWWEEVSGFDSRFNGVDDLDFIWRLALQGCSATWLRQITVGYRQHQQTVSTQKAKERAETFIALQDHFFNQTNLPPSVHQLEKIARYEALTWLSWHLYHTGHPSVMAEFLFKSLSYTPYTLAVTISDWIHRFKGYCLAYGYQLDLKRFRSLTEWQHLIAQIRPQKKPRVSVIIPTYNCERFIEQAVKSVLEQTYQDYEVIVVDDGSTDQTSEVLQPYWDVIRYIKQKNQGAAIARNHGCQLAQGELLAFLDGDDFFFPNKLTEQVACFDQDSQIDLVQSGWLMIDQKGQEIKAITPWYTVPQLDLETWVLHKCVRPSTLILRREWWERVGGFNSRYLLCEDLDFVIRLSLMGCHCIWFKEIHACYRQHGNNLMSSGSAVIEYADILMKEFFARPDIPEKIRKLQPKEHYQRWVWLAWKMYRDGYWELMEQCLEKTLEQSLFPVTETISHWIDSFKNISEQVGESINLSSLITSPDWQILIKKAMNYSPKKLEAKAKNVPIIPKKHHIMLMNTDDPGIGGLAQYDHLILCQLARLGYQVTAVRPQHSNPLVYQEKELGIQQYWLDYSTSSDLSRILRSLADAEKIYQEVQPDFIIFSDGWPFSHFAAKQVAIQQGIPYMIAIGLAMPEHLEFSMGDGVPYPEGVLYQYGLAKVFNTAAAEHLRILHEQFKVPQDKGNVVYYGRSEKYFAPPNPEIRQRLREEIGIPEDGIICLTTARLAPIKGHRFQLDAIAQLKHTPVWENLYFVWPGTGQGSDRNVEPELRETVQQLGVSDRVKFLGQRWDIPDWLDASDIFVLTSLAEAAPSFAIMEAMAKGLPIVASAAGGIPEGLGDTGKLLPDPNVNPEATVQELVKTLQEWAVNPQLRQSIGQASKKRAEKLFKEDRMLKETIEIIEAALLSSTADTFANLPTIQTGVKRLNQRLQYASWVWNAWHAYTHQDTDQMLRALQKAKKYSPFEFATETLLDWVNDFIRLSSQQGEKIEAFSLCQSAAWKQVVEQTLGVML